jgi:hypothetical protein
MLQYSSPSCLVCGDYFPPSSETKRKIKLHCKQFSTYVFPKRSTKYLQNRFIITCPELRNLNFAQKYTTRCSQLTVTIGKNIFPKGIMKSQ